MTVNLPFTRNPCRDGRTVHVASVINAAKSKFRSSGRWGVTGFCYHAPSATVLNTKNIVNVVRAGLAAPTN